MGWWVGAEIGVIEEKVKRSFDEIENKWLAHKPSRKCLEGVLF